MYKVNLYTNKSQTTDFDIPMFLHLVSQGWCTIRTVNAYRHSHISHLASTLIRETAVFRCSCI